MALAHCGNRRHQLRKRRPERHQRRSDHILRYARPNRDFRSARDEYPGPGDDPIVAPNGAAFRRQPGILTQILDELFPRREAAKAVGDRVASQAIKILMNSFYGVLGTPACRFHNPELANAITSFGREVLLWSKARIESFGKRVLYGDTDSLFVESDRLDGVLLAPAAAFSGTAALYDDGYLRAPKPTVADPDGEDPRFHVFPVEQEAEA